MPKALVIVESPAKAKTINKYLGKQYVVKASLGHIQDLSAAVGQSAPRPLRRPGADGSAARDRGARARNPRLRKEGILDGRYRPARADEPRAQRAADQGQQRNTRAPQPGRYGFAGFP